MLIKIIKIVGYVPNIPDRYIDNKIYEDCVSRDAFALIYVPDDAITPKLWDLAIENYPHFHRYLTNKKSRRILENDRMREHIISNSPEFYWQYMIERNNRKIEKLRLESDRSNLFKYLSQNDILGNLSPDDIELCLSDINGLVLTGEQYNKYFSHIKQYKITNEKNTHNKFEFKEGINDDTENFNPLSYCNNGIYFSPNPDKWARMYYCNREQCNLYDVVIPPDAIVKLENNKMKSDLIILKNRRPYKNSSSNE